MLDFIATLHDITLDLNIEIRSPIIQLKKYVQILNSQYKSKRICLILTLSYDQVGKNVAKKTWVRYVSPSYTHVRQPYQRVNRWLVMPCHSEYSLRNFPSIFFFSMQKDKNDLTHCHLTQLHVYVYGRFIFFCQKKLCTPYTIRGGYTRLYDFLFFLSLSFTFAVRQSQQQPFSE